MNTQSKLLIGGVATLAVVGATAAGLAYANPTEPAPTPSTSGQAQPTPGTTGQGGRPGHRLLGRALHGEATLKGGKHTDGKVRVVVFQRGTVTELSATSIELRSEDGFEATYVIDGAVRVRTGREPGQLGDVKSGAFVRLLATKDGSTLTARRIIVVR